MKNHEMDLRDTGFCFHLPLLSGALFAYLLLAPFGSAAATSDWAPDSLSGLIMIITIPGKGSAVQAFGDEWFVRKGYHFGQGPYSYSKTDDTHAQFTSVELDPSLSQQLNRSTIDLTFTNRNRGRLVSQWHDLPDGDSGTTRGIFSLARDTSRPTVKIIFPASGARVKVPDLTVRGNAMDNGVVSQVWYQLNTQDWGLATTVNGRSNWAAQVTATPGSNRLKVYAVDAAGNRSLTNAVGFTYVLSAPLSLTVVGKGKVTGATNGQPLEIGKSVTLGATPASGYGLANWLVQVEGATVLSTNRARPFVMQPNLAVTATFADLAKPKVIITAPTNGQRCKDAVFTLKGKATDNDRVAELWYQLNTSEWALASTANRWSNFTATLNLKPGANILRVYASDATGNRSAVVTNRFTYVVTYSLADYWHPVAVGNQWVYKFTHSSAYPTHSVIRIASTSHRLNCYRGRTSPIRYFTNVISLYSSYCDYRDGMEQNIDDTWYEYYTTMGGIRIWGSDDDPGTVPDPDEERLRVDGGALFGTKMALGQTLSYSRDFYEDGTFVGSIPMTVQLVSHGSVTVPAGTFADSLRIKVTHTIGGSPRSFEEWWVKGIGMVKKVSTSSSGRPHLDELQEFTLVGQSPIELSEAPSSSLGQIASDNLTSIHLRYGGKSMLDGKPCLELRLGGRTQATMVLESSADLVHWERCQTTPLPTTGAVISLPMGGERMRFYRLVKP